MAIRRLPTRGRVAATGGRGAPRRLLVFGVLAALALGGVAGGRIVSGTDGLGESALGAAAACTQPLCASATPTSGAAPLKVTVSVTRGVPSFWVAVKTWGAWRVDFGDRSTAVVAAPSAQLTASHTYTAPGRYAVTSTAMATYRNGGSSAVYAPVAWVTVTPPVATTTSGPGSSAAPQIGFSEDATKYAEDGGDRLFSAMDRLGATTNRVVVPWNADAPTTIQDQAFLDRMVPVANRHHVQLVFAVYPSKPSQAPTTAAGVEAFCSYAAQVMGRYPSVKKVIVGNEPNQPRFWQPIWNANGTPASPAAMEAVLASCYDKLKALDPSIDVIGVGLSPRGNDDPAAASNSSMSPVRWIAALGTAYRATGRTRPLFDEWSWHCYPNVNTDAVETGYAWPNTGCVNAARVKLALWDAFNGTPQPVPAGYAPATTGATLFGNVAKTFLDEVGWQVDTTGRPGYTGTENVPTISEAQQAANYEKLVRLADCEPTLSALHVFHEIDEQDRSGFQSGVLRADGSERPSATDATTSLQHAVAADRGTCSGGVYGALGGFLYPTNAVVPLYKAFPYGSPQPLVSKTTSGGGIYLALQAGEGFTFSVRFTSGPRSTAWVEGAARTGSTTLKVPTGYATGIATVVLRAETNPKRSTTVGFSLGTGTPTPVGAAVGTLLRDLVAPYANGRPLAFDGSRLFAGTGGTTVLYRLDPATGKSLGTLRVGWNENRRHYCCVQTWSADFANGQLYLASVNFAFSTHNPNGNGEAQGEKLGANPPWTCPNNGGGLGINPYGFAVLPSNQYAFAGPLARCVVLAAPAPYGGIDQRRSAFATNDPMIVQGLARDGGNGLWASLSGAGGGKLVRYTTAGKVLSTLSLGGFTPTGIAYDAKTFAPNCALWVNEARSSGSAHIRAYAVPCG